MSPDLKVTVGDAKGRIEQVGTNRFGPRSRSPSYMENAVRALQRAERSMEKEDYAGVLKECQNCIEKGHDVSDSLQEAFQKLSGVIPTAEVISVQSRLAKVGILSKLLYALRDYSNYGDERLNVSSGNLFSNDFGKTLSKLVLIETENVYRCVSEVIERLLR